MSGPPDPRRPFDPVIAGLTDGATSGYRAVDRVVQSLRDGMSRQGAAGWPAPGRGGPTARAPRGAQRSARQARPAAGFPGGSADGFRIGSATGYYGGPPRGSSPPGRTRPSQWYRGPYQEVLSELVDLLDDAVSAATNVVDEISGLAEPLLERKHHHERDDERDPAEIRLTARCGHAAHHPFFIWNTGSKRLSDVRFHATELTGAHGSIPPEHITFSPEKIPALPPGSSDRVELTITIAHHLRPGRYRGIVQASVVGTWAVIELDVCE